MLKRTLVLTIVFGVVVLLLYTLLFWRKHLPRYQLAGRSLGILTSCIQEYIGRYGEMPTGLDALEQANILQRETPNTYIYGGRELYYIEDVVVDWDIAYEHAVVHDGQLVDRNTGRTIHIIGLDDTRPLRGEWPYYSQLIWEALEKARNVDTQPNDNKGE